MSALPLRQAASAFDGARIVERLRAVEAAMRGRFLAESWPAADIDLLFVHYLFGFVMEALPDSSADPCLAWLSQLGSDVIASDDVDRAVHRPGPLRDSGFGRLADLFERVGRRDAASLAEGKRLQGPGCDLPQPSLDRSPEPGALHAGLPPVLAVVGGTSLEPARSGQHPQIASPASKSNHSGQ